MSRESPIFCYKDKQSVSGEKQEAWDAQIRSLYLSVCPYCKSVCREFDKEAVFDSAEENHELSVCMKCGWWSYKMLQAPDLNGEAYFFSASAIMKKFAIDDKDIPTTELSRYLSRNPDKLGSINPTKFEALVADVYRDVLDCKIEACSYGRPDLGVDVVALRKENGEVLAIQVKRYNRPIELGQIHQFAGAMFDGGYSHGVFVTIGHYRSGAKETATRITREGVIKIDLVDGARFLGFLALLNKQRGYVECPYWGTMGYLSSFFNDDRRIQIKEVPNKPAEGDA